MVSRFLTSIDEQMKSTSDAVTIDCLIAKKASYHARQGDFELAEGIVSTLRERYSHRPNVRISAWMNLIEGLVEFFKDMNATALDKFRRSYALAAAGKYPSLEALAGGWIAHFEFGRQEVKKMHHHLERSLLCARPEDHYSLARVSLVCAVALHIAGRYDLARPWYHNARLHANAEGDDASISALMFNLSSMAVMNLRQSVLTKSDLPASVDALAEIGSTGTYDEMVGAISLNSSVPILQANILSLRGDFSGALKLYTAHNEHARAQGMDRMMSYIEADMAWCMLRMGKSEAARVIALSAESNLEISRKIDVDDRAATHSRLAQVFSEIGSFEDSEKHARFADEGWRQFSSFQGNLLSAITSLPEIPKPPNS